MCVQEGSRSKCETRCNKYAGAKECWFLLLWEWYHQLCWSRTWCWKDQRPGWKAYWDTSIETLKAQQLLRTSVPVYCSICMVSWFIFSSLWWNVVAFLKDLHLSINSVVKFHHLLWIPSSCWFCQTCNLYIQSYLKHGGRCTRHAALSLLREFQLLPEPLVFYSENVAPPREREWTNEEIIHLKIKIDLLSMEEKGWRLNKTLLLFTQEVNRLSAKWCFFKGKNVLCCEIWCQFCHLFLSTL